MDGVGEDLGAGFVAAALPGTMVVAGATFVVETFVVETFVVETGFVLAATFFATAAFEVTAAFEATADAVLAGFPSAEETGTNAKVVAVTIPATHNASTALRFTPNEVVDFDGDVEAFWNADFTMFARLFARNGVLLANSPFLGSSSLEGASEDAWRSIACLRTGAVLSSLTVDQQCQ
jgi:FAD/FMN-containing dehydrogenase